MTVPVVQAATITLGVNATDNLPNANEGLSLRVLLKVSAAGVFVGNATVNSVATGYELVANKEYTFIVVPSPQLGAGSADYGLGIWNHSGSPVTYSYVVTTV